MTLPSRTRKYLFKQGVYSNFQKIKEWKWNDTNNEQFQKKRIKTVRFLNLSSLPWESCLFLLNGGGAVPPFSSFLEVTMPDVLGNEGGGAMGVFWPFLGTSEAGEPDELGLASADFLLIAPNTEEAIEFSLKPNW